MRGLALCVQWRFCQARGAVVGHVDEGDDILGDIANLTLGAQGKPGGAQQVVPMEMHAAEQQMRVAL